jgi:hypothetical protein
MPHFQMPSLSFFDQRRYQFTIGIHHAGALLVHGLTSTRGHVRFDLFVILLDLGRFLGRDGRSAIALLATRAFARIQIADETFFEKVLADEGAAVFDHGRSLRNSEGERMRVPGKRFSTRRSL